MTRSNELGMPIWLSTSRFAPPTEILRTKQSIPEPSNEIVPAIMTFWPWVPRLWSIRPPYAKAFKISLKRPLAFCDCGHLGGRDARLINASRSERSAIGGGQVLRANDPPAASPFRLTAGAGFLIECQRRPVLECSRRV